MPPFSVKDHQGQPISIDDLVVQKDYLLAVFLMPKCPISKFSAEQTTKLYDQYTERITFIGLYFGSQAQAADYQEKNQIKFTVYSIKDTPDPLAVSELINEVGSSYGLRNAIYGGTVLLVDQDRNIISSLVKEDLRKLSDELAKL